MSIILKNVKDEKSFDKIASLYKKSFPAKERIKTKAFHRYAFNDGIYFKSFYDNKLFIGFVKGFCDGKNLYISWIASINEKYWKIMIEEIKKLNSKFNVIFVLRSESEIEKFYELDFKSPKLGKILEASKGIFVCTKPELFIDKEIVDGIKKYDWPLMFGTNTEASVYYSNVSSIDIENNLKKLPKIRLEKAQRLVFDKDKKLSIGAYMLLDKALKLHHISLSDYEFKYDEKGKPFLKGCPLKFSISHSGDYVCVALSKSDVGVDIQKMDDINTKVNRLVFNDRDSYFYESSEDKKYAFYKIWTFKEAYAKKTGEGLTKELKDISINYLFEFNGSFFYNFNIIEEYQISVCSSSYGIKTIKELKI